MNLSVMKIHQYEVNVNLGCSEEEQSVAQSVLFDIEIHFTTNIQAERTDLLKDSIDYVQITEITKACATSKKFSMIEHLCFSVSQLIKNEFGQKFEGELIVSCLKRRPPINNLQGGVSWTCRTALSF